MCGTSRSNTGMWREGPAFVFSSTKCRLLVNSNYYLTGIDGVAHEWVRACIRQIAGQDISANKPSQPSQRSV